MRTVPTLAASGAGISLSAVGLALVRPDDEPRIPQHYPHSRPATTGQHSRNMTAVAAYSSFPHERQLTDLDIPLNRSLSTPRSTRPKSSRRSTSDSKEKRGALASGGSKQESHARTSIPGSEQEIGRRLVKRLPQKELDEVKNITSGPAGFTTSRPKSWLRRLSSSVTSSRDSSITPGSLPSSRASSRPLSLVASKSNGSPAVSEQDVERSPALFPPNRLVKRASSVRSTTSSPYHSSPSSRLPVPVFRRPATSYQRSASAPNRWSDIGTGARAEGQLRQYFTPRIPNDPSVVGRRLSSGIPNPIRRVYPDRKYTPMLVSASEPIKQAQVELDAGFSSDDDSHGLDDGLKQISASAASSPVPVQPSFFEQSQTPRRSFSIGDLLSSGPSPQAWKRQPYNPKRRSASGRLSRNDRTRVVSAPSSTMGSSLSSSIGAADTERPSKRRGIADTTSTAPRSVYSSSSSVHAAVGPSKEDRRTLPDSSPIVSFPPYAEAIKLETPTRSLAPSPFEPNRQESGTSESSAARISSTAGSESERQSLGGFSTDQQSDTFWDSLPTRTTRSSSGKRGPPIDTIFDESPPPTFSSGRSTRLSDFLGENNILNSGHSSRYRHSTIEEEGSLVSTPVRSVRDKSANSTPSGTRGSRALFLSSPQMRPVMPEPDEIDWDAPDEDPMPKSGLRVENQSPMQQPIFLKGKVGFFTFQDNSPTETPGRQARADRANLFDWAEQQPSPSHGDQSPPRPKTVHGKKEPEGRGSRTAGRRAPSGIHARSHSVPVVPDVDGKRTNIVANKFGTWGVGTKAVTEDWNEDFDFDEDSALQATIAQTDDKRIDSGHAMFVPPSIRQQQENVVAHIGLLREWGLLIEELKDLRARAMQLDMLSGPYAQILMEIDGMIELADQESDETTLEASRSPPSSPPSFDTSDHDDEPATRPTNRLASAVRESPLHSSVLPTRPRKDSEAVARSVIEALQTKRAVSDPLTKSAGPNKKVPFDTATLRHIVPYVNGLKRKIKDGLRETEGLYYSPRRKSSSSGGFEPSTPKAGAPPFSHIFNGPSAGSPSSRGANLRRQEAATDQIDSEAELGQEVQKMHLSPH